ncbi:unnamed protein product [Amoebophrya sp. A25]|nr:unnamed protein product [Amoebophrya sp. A25]|eukprot:GSA25T00013410001.1
MKVSKPPHPNDRRFERIARVEAAQEVCQLSGRLGVSANVSTTTAFQRHVVAGAPQLQALAVGSADATPTFWHLSSH